MTHSHGLWLAWIEFVLKLWQADRLNPVCLLLVRLRLLQQKYQQLLAFHIQAAFVLRVNEQALCLLNLFDEQNLKCMLILWTGSLLHFRWLESSFDIDDFHEIVLNQLREVVDILDTSKLLFRNEQVEEDVNELLVVLMSLELSAFVYLQQMLYQELSFLDVKVESIHVFLSEPHPALSLASLADG